MRQTQFKTGGDVMTTILNLRYIVGCFAFLFVLGCESIDSADSNTELDERAASTGHTSNNLVPGGQLTLNQYLQSSDGSHRLNLQGDGNLVLLRMSDKKPLWASGTNGKSVTLFRFRTGGDLVLRTASGSTVWSSKTDGSGATKLHLHSAGNLVLYKDSTVVWSVNGSPVTDECPNDPNKTKPGLCGCGVPEGTCSGGDSKCVTAVENATASLSCSSGQVIKSISFASYGKPSGTCPNFSIGTCHASSSQSKVQSLCLNKPSCSVAASNGVFGDPCSGVPKNLVVAYTCGGGVDNCPNDPNKTEPGQCGCGVPEGSCSGGSVNCVLNPYSGVDWSSWKQYKANYHTHTTQSDGDKGRHDTIKQYRDADYDILSITDHNMITWPWPSDIDTGGMLGVRGDEYSKSEHMNAFFNFTKTSSTLQDGIPHIASQGGTCQINHPGREHSASEWSWFIPWFRDYSCFGLEVFNSGDKYSNDRKLWDNINENYFKSNGRLVWGTSNDDKHDSSDLYRNFQFMVMPSLSESNLRKSMKNGAFYFAYEPGGSGSAKVPRISQIEVNNSAKTITITATGANKIYWVGPGTSTVTTGSTFNFSNYSKPFVRAVLDGSSGDSFSQPFGFKSN
jgi:hypothetical protein